MEVDVSEFSTANVFMFMLMVNEDNALAKSFRSACVAELLQSGLILREGRHEPWCLPDDERRKLLHPNPGRKRWFEEAVRYWMEEGLHDQNDGEDNPQENPSPRYDS